MQNRPKTHSSLNFNRMIRYALVLIPIGVAGNIIFSLLKTDKKIFHSLDAFSLEYLLLALVLGLVPWLMNSVRIWVWARFLGKKYRFVDMFKMVLACELGAGVSPTAVGGGYVKVAVLVQKGMSPGAATSLMTLGSVEDFLFFAVAIPLSFLLTSSTNLQIFSEIVRRLQNQWAFLLHVILGLIFLSSFILVFKRTKMYRRLVHIPIFARILLKLKKFWTDFIAVYAIISRRGKTRLAFSLFLTSLQWICRYSVISALLACLKVPVQPVKFFILQWIVFTFGTFTPTPGGSIGVEAAFYFTYRNLIPGSMIGLVTAGWRFLTYYLQLILGTVLFSVLHFKIFSKISRKRHLRENQMDMPSISSAVKGNP